ncbi:TlyA family RNA methyltransferase [Alkalibacter mobilis]|uniref:TlyA family RNA methyltransferase n=1 Tax=Alkalibacter mobilis TaxID=2787712 RepID=UPI00189F87E8|nr:TlyA family RNA methyltransferase [Alkalibacter mobilis]MBF7097115.1 TlyA family RNA methyltransferase [Alkalibacter mobilis]
MSRLDVYLHEKGFYDSREQAKRNVMAGNVSINGKMADKPGMTVKDGDIISVKEKECPFVSRGGFKLDKAIKTFGLDLQGNIAMDVGASTGGFTDCMLQYGADKVYSVDVGYGQLDWKLRSDARVVSMERKNFRHMEFDEIGEKVDFLVMDVSFISVTKLVDRIKMFLKENGNAVILIKPQFEAGKDRVGKKGIVKDPDVHFEVIKDVIIFFENSGMSVIGLDFSPVKGAKGNIEYLILVKYDISEIGTISEEIIKEIVKKANEGL